MKRYIYTLIALLTVAACSPELPESPELLVIEGWIENGEAPVVFVTSSLQTTFEEKGLTDLIDHVALDANVTVTHDGQTYKLSPVLNNDYLLRICYTTNKLKGDVGGTYRLDVDWKGMHADAETTIPVPGHIDSTMVERHQAIDTMYILKAHIVPAPEERYYRFFSMAVGKDSTYNPSYLGTFDSQLKINDLCAVNRGRNNPIYENDVYYTINDSVRFKLASMGSEAYEFWRKFDENLMFSHVPLLPYSDNLRSNISGGLGYWFGYGINTYSLRIRPE